MTRLMVKTLSLHITFPFFLLLFAFLHFSTHTPLEKSDFWEFCEALKRGQTGGLTGVRARGPKSGVFARGHMALSAEINRFVLYLEAPPPPTTRWTPVLAIPGRDTTFRKNDSANGNILY